VKVDVAVLGSPSLIDLTVFVDVKQHFEEESKKIRAQEGAVSKSRCTVSVDVKQHLKVFDDR